MYAQMGPQMRGQLFGFSTEFLLLELTYFLVVAGICLYIYFRTREVYSLSKHPGLFHFRNIFLYFSLAYFFRLVIVFFMLSGELMEIRFRGGFFGASEFSLLFAGYFSTMAILSLAMSVLSRKIKADVEKTNYLLHGLAIVSSLLVFFTGSYNLLVSLQVLALVGIIFAVLTSPWKAKGKGGFSQTKATYVLLAFFWIVNLFAFSRVLLPPELKTVLYILSAGVFVSIFARVQKRLPNAEKKQA